MNTKFKPAETVISSSGVGGQFLFFHVFHAHLTHMRLIKKCGPLLDAEKQKNPAPVTCKLIRRWLTSVVSNSMNFVIVIPPF